MSGLSSIKSKVDGKVHDVDGGNCKTKRIVYCGDCVLCGMQYVGQTVRPGTHDVRVVHSRNIRVVKGP